MNENIPRLRMFAGPNGSGKSTFKAIIQSELLGIYINTDQVPAWFEKALGDQFNIKNKDDN